MQTSTRSNTGAWFCGVYLAASSVCVTFALWPGTDLKGRYVFLQLPIALQSAALQALGLARHLQGLGWLGAYLILGLPTLALLYLAGRLFDRVR